MAKYRKKPIVIEAFKFGYDEMPLWASNCPHLSITDYEKSKATVHTLEGDMYVRRGSYIIKGVEGELYPCKSEIFNKTYEAVE